MKRTHLAICALLVLTSCSALQGGPGAGELRLRATEMTTTGAHASIRGTVENTFNKPVHGVRYMVTIIDKRTSQKVDIWQQQVDTTIQPGERSAVSLEVESESLVGRNTRLMVKAAPMTVGNKSMPPPAGWKD